jgi:uncharacterized protein YcbK (DUF882 family)
MKKAGPSEKPTRRQFVIGKGALAASLLLPVTANAASPRRLNILSLHTGETASVDYLIDGQVQTDALRTLDHVLGDHRTSQIIKMDRALFDLLHQLSQLLKTDAPFHIISGYRSPRTNAMLAGKSPVELRPYRHRPRTLLAAGVAPAQRHFTLSTACLPWPMT